MYGTQLAALAMVVATAVSNSACVFYIYQDELPEDVKKLRKF
jgi:cyclic lactone autoinducer peptide